MARHIIGSIMLAVAFSGIPACGDAAPSGGQVPAGDLVSLPPPRTDGAVSLESALAGRRSVRSYTDAEPSVEDLSQLLWAAQGETSAGGGRTAPSAGGLYPLELYVASAGGVHHYLPGAHRLETLTRADVRQSLADAGLGQDALREAPLVFIFAAAYDRTAQKYGGRAERYVQLEAGHAAQNLLLQAVALGLGAVPIGAFDDGDVGFVLGLPADQRPLYLVPVGRPSEQ